MYVATGGSMIVVIHMLDRDKVDYEQTIAYFKELHETRFRLLALLPIAAGFAVGFLPRVTNTAQGVALGVLGFVVTIGLTIYDQRNTMIYDRLIRRAKLLERTMGFKPMQIPPDDTERDCGGPLWDRPERRFLFIIWHDLGLSFVYAGSLSAWVFLIVQSFEIGSIQLLYPLIKLVPVIFGVLTFAFLIVLARLNDRENDRIDVWIKKQPSGS